MLRWFGWFALVLLAGCDYCCTRQGAPFRLRHLQGQVWAPSPTNTESTRQAMLILAEEEFTCPVYADAYLTVDQLISEGKGLIFEFDASGSTTDEVRDWEGLWTTENSYGLTQGSSEVAVRFFNEGVMNTYSEQFDTSCCVAWIDLDAVDELGAAGTFDVGYWHGRFSVPSCGDSLQTDSPSLSNPYTDSF